MLSKSWLVLPLAIAACGKRAPEPKGDVCEGIHWRDVREVAIVRFDHDAYWRFRGGGRLCDVQVGLVAESQVAALRGFDSNARKRLRRALDASEPGSFQIWSK